MRPQYALKLDKRFLIENHFINFFKRNAGKIEAELASQHRETVVMLDAVEALFLCRNDNHAVPNQSHRAIVIICRYSQYYHSQNLK